MADAATAFGGRALRGTSGVAIGVVAPGVVGDLEEAAGSAALAAARSAAAVPVAVGDERSGENA